MQMLNSDVLISFYVLLGAGSLSILGAFKPNKVEPILIIFSIVVASSMSIILRATEFDTSLNSTYDLAMNVMTIIRYVCLLLGILSASYDLYI